MYAKYTEVLKNLIENEHTKPLIDKALSTYPLLKVNKEYDLIPTREELNTKLLNHYKYREIGFETVGRFIDELEITMCEIMPYYNERFKTVITMADLPNPFDNVDIVETYDEERTNTVKGSNKSESAGESKSNNDVTSNASGSDKRYDKKVHSDTPQSELSITGKDIDGVGYADSVEWNSNEGESTSESKSNSNGSSNESASAQSESNTSENGTTKHTYMKKGNQGVNTYAHDMNEFRTSIIDVVTEIINDKHIAELFMLVY